MITTASGTVSVDTKRISSILINSLELKDVDVYAHNFPDECFSDGVLGMNVLDKFNFNINLDNNIIDLYIRRI